MSSTRERNDKDTHQPLRPPKRPGVPEEEENFRSRPGRGGYRSQGEEGVNGSFEDLGFSATSYSQVPKFDLQQATTPNYRQDKSGPGTVFEPKDDHILRVAIAMGSKFKDIIKFYVSEPLRHQQGYIENPRGRVGAVVVRE
ncbi:hypothetical protein J7T55_015658 [Diaporthe amygdali]|uniref:uncharacterized protein n=1 Tax=Phomopsis amygdali TaxID=1214568 RepID=UPI0022FDBEAC|nr:uncharacterized protein J7T55_015658 [Diaporthe amygdali]KAJ0120920.1 hypothetical protein J7T55_015658 [Diaporthe amygdali]